MARCTGILFAYGENVVVKCVCVSTYFLDVLTKLPWVKGTDDFFMFYKHR